MSSLRKWLFEHLLLFDKLSLKITGESIPISFLIGTFGRKGFDALIEQRALEFVLWNEKVGFLDKNVPGIDGMVSMVHNDPISRDETTPAAGGALSLRDPHARGTPARAPAAGPRDDH